MALWWKSMRGLVNESPLWQKHSTGSYHNSRTQSAVGFLFSEHIKRLRRRDILRDSVKKQCVPDDEVLISVGQSRKDVWFRLDSLSFKNEATLWGLWRRMSWALRALWVGEIRGRMSWNERRWSWWQQEPLCLGFTALPQQTCSVTLKRCSYCSRANTWEGTGAWCSDLAAGWVNNMLMQVSLNININS